MPGINGDAQCACEEGQIGFLFFLSAPFVLIKTLWDYWEEFNVLKDRSMLRVTYIVMGLPWS